MADVLGYDLRQPVPSKLVIPSGPTGSVKVMKKARASALALP